MPRIISKLIKSPNAEKIHSLIEKKTKTYKLKHEVSKKRLSDVGDLAAHVFKYFQRHLLFTKKIAVRKNTFTEACACVFKI